jgi:hypothetical protein
LRYKVTEKDEENPVGANVERCIRTKYCKVFRRGTEKIPKDNAETQRSLSHAEALAFGFAEAGQTGRFWGNRLRAYFLNRFNHGDFIMTKRVRGARMRSFGGLRK